MSAIEIYHSSLLTLWDLEATIVHVIYTGYWIYFKLNESQEVIPSSIQEVVKVLYQWLQRPTIEPFNNPYWTNQ